MRRVHHFLEGWELRFTTFIELQHILHIGNKKSMAHHQPKMLFEMTLCSRIMTIKSLNVITLTQCKAGMHTKLQSRQELREGNLAHIHFEAQLLRNAMLFAFFLDQ